MDEKLINEYKAMLPVSDSLESVVAKGKVEHALINAKLALEGIKKDDFLAWKENPMKYACKHDQKKYEQLMAVGYHPQLRELMGVIYVKLPYGYGGSCPNGMGSMEYVRFYVDWTNDGDFKDAEEDQGLGKVHVFDPGNENEKKMPIEYGAENRIVLPPKILELLESKCQVRRVRAILSWITIPPARRPDWKPFWGNVVETNIRFHR
jgi:hypothetical protein